MPHEYEVPRANLKDTGRPFSQRKQKGLEISTVYKETTFRHKRSKPIDIVSIPELTGKSPQTEIPPIHEKQTQPNFTERQKKVVTLLARGKEHPEIAKELSISPATAGREARRAHSKMQTSSPLELALRSLKDETINPQEILHSVKTSGIKRFTDEEKMVIDALLANAGTPQKELAKQLSIGQTKMSEHLQTAREKIEASSTVHLLTAYAASQGEKWKESFRPPEQKKFRSKRLTSRQKEVLTLIACGQEHKAIEKKLGISSGTLLDHIKVIHEKLQTSTPLEAGLKSLYLRQISAEAILDGIDKRELKSLTTTQKEILDTLMENAGTDLNHAQIFRQKGISRSTKDRQLKLSRDHVHAKDTTHLVLAYAASLQDSLAIKKQNESQSLKIQFIEYEKQILTLWASGYENSQIADVLKTTIKKPDNYFHKRLGTKSLLQAALRGIYFEIIDPLQTIKDIDMKSIKKLTDRQKMILDTLIENAGTNKNNKAILAHLNLSKGSKDRALQDAKRKTNARNTVHLAVAYAISKGLNWEKNIPQLEYTPLNPVEELAHGATITAIVHKTDITEKTIASVKSASQSPTLLEAVLKTYKPNEAEKEAFMQNINIFAFEQLTDLQRKTLDRLILHNGRYASYTSLAKYFRKEKRSIRERLRTLNNKIGTKTNIQLATAYKLYRQMYDTTNFSDLNIQ